MTQLLIIDDESQIRSMLRQMLEQEGYDVIEASNGEEGIKLYREKPADLVITDILMPVKEGFTTIMELKRDYPEVRIIAISGGRRIGPEEYLKIAKKFGAIRMINKPFNKEELLNAIEDLIG